MRVEPKVFEQVEIDYGVPGKARRKEFEYGKKHALNCYLFRLDLSGAGLLKEREGAGSW